MAELAGHNETIPSSLSTGMAGGLAVLLQGHRFAQDVDVDLWQFAVELPVLRDEGMTCTDLRWLLHKGYVEHKREVSSSYAHAREFRSIGSVKFRKRSCFRLTDSGVRFAERGLSGIEKLTEMITVPNVPKTCPAPPANGPHSLSMNGAAAASLNPDLNEQQCECALQNNSIEPKWNGERHLLRVGDKIVKEFKVPSANQEAILTAFEEEGWPERIDDPLTPVGRIDPKRRLHDAIKGLNRNQKNSLIRFRGDGTGEGVQWSLISAGDVSMNAAD